MRWVVIVNNSYAYGPFTYHTDAEHWAGENLGLSDTYHIVQYIDVTKP